VEDVFSYFEKPKNLTKFNAMKISVASPEKIRSWSHGEVKNRRRSITGLSNRKRRFILCENFRSRQGL